ncbi:MAG: histidine kinase [Clostridia bacterium]|nr:histidine kinase [Clostridia bacterium]
MKLSLNKMIFGMVIGVSVIIVIFQLVGIFVMFRMFDEQKQETIDGIVTSVALTIEERMQTLYNISKYLQNNDCVWQYLVNSNNEISSGDEIRVTDELSSVDYLFSDSVSVVLVDKKEEKFHTFLNTVDNDEFGEITTFYQQYKEEGEKQKSFFFTKPGGLYYELGICNFSPIEFHNTQEVGIVNAGTAIVINRVNVFRLLKDMDYTNKVGIMLTDFIGGKEANFMKELQGEIISLKSKHDIAGTSWTVSGAMVFDNQTSSVYHMIMIVMTELIVLVLLLVVVQFILLNKLIRKPLSTIIHFVDNSILHNTRNRLKVSNSLSEFETLSQHINTMLDKSEELFHKVVHTQQELYELELSNKEAAIYALQSQINPHFLYNTLECMSAVAMLYGATRVVDMVESLSRMFRYSMDGNRESTVGEEIGILEDYLSIMRNRFPDSFDTELDFDDDVWNKRTLRMLFQPIAENSVKHGFVDCGRRGLLKIKGYADGDKLVVEFFDNGGGMSEEKLIKLLSEINSSSQSPYTNRAVGLANINRRIRLQYGNGYGIAIMSKQNEFTEIRLELPLE